MILPIVNSSKNPVGITGLAIYLFISLSYSPYTTFPSQYAKGVENTLSPVSTS